MLVFQGQRDRRKDTTFGFHEDLFKYKKTRCNAKLMRTPHLPLGVARPCLHEQLPDAVFWERINRLKQLLVIVTTSLMDC